LKEAILSWQNPADCFSTGTIIETKHPAGFHQSGISASRIGKIIATKLERKAKSAGLAKLDLSASLNHDHSGRQWVFFATGNFFAGDERQKIDILREIKTL